MGVPGRALWDGNLVEYHFYGILGPSTTVVLERTPNGGPDMQGYHLPGDGWIVAVTAEAHYPAGSLAGSATVQAWVDRSAVTKGPKARLLLDQGRATAVSRHRGQFTVPANSYLGVTATSDANWPDPVGVTVRVLIGYDRVGEGG